VIAALAEGAGVSARQSRCVLLTVVLVVLSGCGGEDTPVPAELSREHVDGPVVYEDTPPIGGAHNEIWQSCQGDVYTVRIASEHAVHSLEHGAVWITYTPGLPAAEVERLAARVRGLDYLLMSPFPDLGSPIALSAWGTSLQVSDAEDPRIDEFIRAHRIRASQEPGASCASPLCVEGVDAPLTRDQLREILGG
jgi:hypothetical protein